MAVSLCRHENVELPNLLRVDFAMLKGLRSLMDAPGTSWRGPASFLGGPFLVG